MSTTRQKESGKARTGEESQPCKRYKRTANTLGNHDIKHRLNKNTRLLLALALSSLHMSTTRQKESGKARTMQTLQTHNKHTLTP